MPEMQRGTHALFTCSYATRVWNLAPFTSPFHANLVETTLAGLDPISPTGGPSGRNDLNLDCLVHLALEKSTHLPTPEGNPDKTKALSDAREWTGHSPRIRSKLLSPVLRWSTSNQILIVKPIPLSSQTLPGILLLAVQDLVGSLMIWFHRHNTQRRRHLSHRP